MKTIKSILVAVLLVITLATTMVAIHFATKYNQAMKCLDDAVILLYDCENYIDDLTDGAYGDTIAEGDSFSNFYDSYNQLTGIQY